MAIINQIPKKKTELANNLETTIAGMAALDAVQGKVLKEQILENKSAFSNRVPKRYFINSQEQLEQVLNNTSDYQDNSIYEYCLSISVGGLTLSGGIWYIKGFRLEGDRWGWQQATCYDNQFKMRSKMSGIWGNWVNEFMSDTIYNQYQLNIEGNINTFYPVVFPYRQEYLNTIELSKYVSTPSTNQGALRARFEYTTSSWGGYPSFSKLAYHLRTQKDFIANATFGSGAVYNLIVWLRGGATYNITDNVKLGKGSVYYTRTEIAHRDDYPYYVEPRTTIEKEYQEQKLPN